MFVQRHSAVAQLTTACMHAARHLASCDWLKFVEGLLDVEECLIHPREGRWAPALVMVSSKVGHTTYASRYRMELFL